MRKRPRYRIIWSKGAADDLKAAVDYLSDRSKQAARKLLNVLEEQLARIVQLPRSGRIVPELQRDDVREVFCRQYRVIYRINDARGHVQILAFIHAARMLTTEVEGS